MIILPKYFDSMIGGADQLINIELRFRDEPDIPVRAYHAATHADAMRVTRQHDTILHEQTFFTHIIMPTT